MLQTMLGYFMMLVAMLFNWSLFFAVVLGTGLGFYVFRRPVEGGVGHSKGEGVDEECC